MFMSLRRACVFRFNANWQVLFGELLLEFVIGFVLRLQSSNNIEADFALYMPANVDLPFFQRLKRPDTCLQMVTSLRIAYKADDLRIRANLLSCIVQRSRSRELIWICQLTRWRWKNVRRCILFLCNNQSSLHDRGQI